MHPDEVHTDAALVRRMLETQFPHWAALPVEPVESYGTDHDVYRLGRRLAARPGSLDRWLEREEERAASSGDLEVA